MSQYITFITDRFPTFTTSASAVVSAGGWITWLESANVVVGFIGGVLGIMAAIIAIVVGIRNHSRPAK